jgi:hypothetical protein
MVKGPRIYDRDITSKNYSRFKMVKINKKKREVTFILAGGAKYTATVPRIMSWFEAPHYLQRQGRLQDWAGPYRKPGSLSVKRSRRVMGGSVVRLYMNDRTAYDVCWDTVLMACEPKYEWYGGFPDYIKALLRKKQP